MKCSTLQYTGKWQHASQWRWPSNWPVMCTAMSLTTTSTACISTSNIVRHDTCRHNCAVHGRVVVASVVTHCCNWPYHILPFVTLGHCYVASGPRLMNLHRQGLVISAVCECGQQQTMNHVVDICLVTKYEGGLQSFHDVDNDGKIPQRYSNYQVKLTDHY